MVVNIYQILVGDVIKNPLSISITWLVEGWEETQEVKKNNVRNLIALCRKCHQRTDVDKEFNEMLKERVNRFVDAKS